MTLKITIREIEKWRKTSRIFRVHKEVEYLQGWLRWAQENHSKFPAYNIGVQMHEAYLDWQADFVKDDTEKALQTMMERAIRLLELYKVNWEFPEWE